MEYIDVIKEYVQAKRELDIICFQMQKDQVLFWKNQTMEEYMKPDDMKENESCQEYVDRIQKENPKLMIAAFQASYMMVYKKIPTKHELFDVWFHENCQSDELQTEYSDHKLELEQMGETIKSFRDWASEKFFLLLETNQIDPEDFDVESFLGESRR